MASGDTLRVGLVHGHDTATLAFAEKLGAMRDIDLSVRGTRAGITDFLRETRDVLIFSGHGYRSASGWSLGGVERCVFSIEDLPRSVPTSLLVLDACYTQETLSRWWECLPNDVTIARGAEDPVKDDEVRCNQAARILCFIEGAAHGFNDGKQRPWARGTDWTPDTLRETWLEAERRLVGQLGVSHYQLDPVRK